MANPSKAKGTKFESAIVDYLNANGYPYAERRAQHGNVDRGDITGLPGIVLECKATRALELGTFMLEAEVERCNASADVAAVVWKRRQRPTADAAVIVPLWQFVELLRDAGR